MKFLAVVPLVMTQVAMAGKLRSEDSSLQIGLKSKVMKFAKGGPSAWEPQYPSTPVEGRDINHPSDDQPGVWQPQYPSSERGRQGESKKGKSDRDRKHAIEKSDEKAAKSASEMQEQNNAESESEEQNTNESSAAKDDSNDRSSDRSSNRTDEKDQKRKDEQHKDKKDTENSTNDRESADASNKNNESKANSTSVGHDQDNKTGKQAAPKSPWQAFLPSCREKLKHLVKVAESSYTRPQIEIVLENECELDKEFPSIRDRFFDRRKECKAFAHELAKARDAEMKGATGAYDDCCKLWWTETHEDHAVNLGQHASDSHFWLWLVLGMLAVGLVVGVVMNHVESP